MKKNTFLLAFTCIIILGIGTEAFGQSRYVTHKNLALGGGGVAYMNDYDALFINPANIWQRRARTTFSFGIANLNVQAGGPLANLTSYNKYLTNDQAYSVADWRDMVVPAFFGQDEDRHLGVQVDVVPLAFSYGNDKWAIAGAARARVITNTMMNGGMMKLLGGFNEEMFGTPTPVNLSQSAFAVAEYSLGFAMPVFDMKLDNGYHRIIVGIAPKMLSGIAYSSFTMASTLEVRQGEFIRHNIDYEIYAMGGIAQGIDRFLADRNGINPPKFNALFDGDYLEDPATNAFGPGVGSGFGLDFGITYQWNPSFNNDLKLTGAFSVTDIGTVTFSKQAGIFGARGEFLFDGVSYDPDLIDEEYDGKFEDYLKYVLGDSLAEGSYGNLEKRASKYSRGMPTMVNIGLMAEWKKFTFVTDLSRGFESFGINSERMIWSMGLEYRVFSFLPLRTGLRTGGISSTAYSFGLGLEFKNYEFGLGGMLTANSTNGTHLGFALSTLNVRF